MSTKLLISTLFEKSYVLFGVEDDRALILKMSQIGLIYTVLTGIYVVFMAVPYGKHSSGGDAFSWIYGLPINAKLAWIVSTLQYKALTAPAKINWISGSRSTGVDRPCNSDVPVSKHPFGKCSESNSNGVVHGSLHPKVRMEDDTQYTVTWHL